MDNINEKFVRLCYLGNLDDIKNMLSLGADVHHQNELGLMGAITKNHLDIVKYLLTSPDLKEHANFEAQYYLAFLIACRFYHSKIIDYFISHYTLPSKTLSLSIYKTLPVNQLTLLKSFLNKNLVFDLEKEKCTQEVFDWHSNFINSKNEKNILFSKPLNNLNKKVVIL